MSSQFRKLDVDEIAKIVESQGYKLQPNTPDGGDDISAGDVACDCSCEDNLRTEYRRFGTDTWDTDSYVPTMEMLKYILAIIVIFLYILIQR
jgi:hypothetical protein